MVSALAALLAAASLSAAPPAVEVAESSPADRENVWRSTPRNDGDTIVTRDLLLRQLTPDRLNRFASKYYTIDVEDTVVANQQPYQKFALKTNILYDAALMPNLEIEFMFNRRWSLLLEGNVAWWKNDPKHKYYQILMFSPEVRRWFFTKDYWHGMYVGLFAGGGKYDLENGYTGYKGEGGMVGVSLGYMWPITRYLSLEAGLGAGYMFSRYEEYIPHDGHYLYQRTKDLNYFGPLKLKLAIAWRFYDINKSKKVKQHYEIE